MSKKRELVYRKIEELSEYENNARLHGEEQVKQIVNSIKEFGFTTPILIGEDDIIIAGHGRLMAAKKLKLKEVPTITLDGLTEAQKKAYVIADNKLTENSTWDMDLLKLEVDSLNEMDFDIELLGFEDNFFEELDAEEGTEELDEEGNPYTAKVDVPTYEPKGEKPALDDIFDMDRCKELIKKIDSSDISKNEKEFLKAAAFRHVKFDYEQVANYYAHSEAKIQDLMEDSALVIIDYDKAIEQGYMNLSEAVDKIHDKEQVDEQ